ncbi:substrate-binding domain-containing protein [uncultured Pseudoflavonifractor sp.]|uniref:sugar ABC transporter substrate-binding protein n=1 Tax=uncultured Pseudoflavonifractor sp. TaxID=1221379 RepID=UPI0025D26607|nr:substrate-binding domain-containing protein [uncultured Pseudoflavonifractor sp.]
MRKRRNDFIQLSILVVLGTAVVLSLVLPQLPGRSREVQLLEVSVIFRETDAALWSNTRLGMEQAAGDLGAELRFLTLTRAGDGGEQAEILRREAAGGANALVVVPADPWELSSRLGETAGGCPVVSIESPMEGTGLTVAPDNEALGRKLAETVLEEWTGGMVLLLDTAGESTGVAARLDGAEAVLTAAGVPVLRQTAAPGRLAAGLRVLASVRAAAAIMAFEPYATEQAIRAVEDGGLHQLVYGVGAGTYVVGALERGSAAAVAAWSDYAAGYLAAEGAIRLARREEYTAEPLPFTIVRGEDIYDPDNQKLLFPVTS